MRQLVRITIKKSDIEKLLQKEFGDDIEFFWSSTKANIVDIEVDLDIIKKVMTIKLQPQTLKIDDGKLPLPAEMLTEEERKARLERIKQNTPIPKIPSRPPPGVMGNSRGTNPNDRNKGRSFNRGLI